MKYFPRNVRNRQMVAFKIDSCFKVKADSGGGVDSRAAGPRRLSWSAGTWTESWLPPATGCSRGASEPGTDSQTSCGVGQWGGEYAIMCVAEWGVCSCHTESMSIFLGVYTGQGVRNVLGSETIIHQIEYITWRVIYGFVILHGHCYTSKSKVKLIMQL